MFPALCLSKSAVYSLKRRVNGPRVDAVGELIKFSGGVIFGGWGEAIFGLQSLPQIIIRPLRQHYRASDHAPDCLQLCSGRAKLLFQGKSDYSVAIR